MHQHAASRHTQIQHLHTRLPIVWRQHARDMSPIRGLPTIETAECTITNYAFESARFRKLHLQLMEGDGVQAVHAVMYPRPNYDIPIVAINAVAFEGTLTLALADACPVTDDLSLPYGGAMWNLQRAHGIKPVSRSRMPPWGQHIFSDNCVILKYNVPDSFGAYVMDMVGVHMSYAAELGPSVDTARLRASHRRFCRNQMANLKTKIALAGVLGAEKAEHYMRTVMFDCTM